MDSGGKKTAVAVLEEVTHEVGQWLQVLFNGRRKTGQVDIISLSECPIFCQGLGRHPSPFFFRPWVFTVRHWNFRPVAHALPRIPIRIQTLAQWRREMFEHAESFALQLNLPS